MLNMNKSLRLKVNRGTYLLGRTKTIRKGIKEK
jgi:ribosomal protein L30E